MRKRIAVFLAEGFEEIEAVTAIDISRRAGFDVRILGVGSGNIRGSRGVTVVTEEEISSYKDAPDAVILPGGGEGVKNLASSQKVGEIVKEAYAGGKLVAAICAAPPYVLAPLGILKGRRATCYPTEREKLGDDVQYADEDVVEDGNLLTSKGPGTAMDFALKIVELLGGRELKEKIREKAQYEGK